ncbi:Aste57867_1517 [Aphanomyces stellatus]|uniref:Aste57867_1517 protein n=1 Tax=Aphanomyces stellatus TaxID=120398 RepID=A0A485KAU2_9STRA|nr:hypothetical protein As57867_001516 [Aphanomyces stellatus]VFT78733.1 Aste57867_1517 [Aphanomyces stellatus]
MTPVSTLNMRPDAFLNFSRIVPLAEPSKDYHHRCGLDEAPHCDTYASKKTRNWEDDEDDTANVDDLSDLFTVIEQEQSFNDACAVDEVMEWFENCEEFVNEEDDANAAVVVDEITEMFDMLEGSEDFVLEDDNDQEAALVDEIADLFDSLEDKAALDAEAVDDVADMFDALEQEAHDEQDAAVVDDFGCLFDMLEEKSKPVAPAAPVVRDCRIPMLDSRIPRVDSRIPQLGQMPQLSSFRLPAVGGFVCGPPLAVKELTREERVSRWREKKRNRASIAAKVVFESRQQVAAKRRRINGRFASLETQFVSVSTFQSN